MDQTLRFLQTENTRLQSENRELQDELRLLQEYVSTLTALEGAAEELASEQELFPLLDKILYYALTLLDSTDGSVILVDEETDECVFAVVRGAIESSLVNYRMPKTQGLTGWVVTHGRPLIVNDVKQDIRFSPQVDRLFDFDTRSMLCVPMKVAKRVLGAISLINKHSGEPFTQIDQGLLSILARTAAFALSQLE